jgi:hypothetical protein
MQEAICQKTPEQQARRVQSWVTPPDMSGLITRTLLRVIQGLLSDYVRSDHSLLYSVESKILFVTPVDMSGLITHPSSRYVKSEHSL